MSKEIFFLLEAPTIASLIQISKIGRLATHYLETGFYLVFWNGYDNIFEMFEYFWIFGSIQTFQVTESIFILIFEDSETDC